MPARSLDELDQRILAQLRSNARVSHAELAQRVHLSRNAVRQRIDRLERDGLIRGYTIVERTDRAVGAVAVLLIQRVDRMRGAAVLSDLQAIDEVVQCDVVSGELDLVVRVEAADAARVRTIWQQVAAWPGVRDITTAISLATTIDRRPQA